MTLGDWPAIEGLEFPRQHGRVEDHDDLGLVNVVPTPVELQQARRDQIERPEVFDDRHPLDPVLLETPSAHRAKTVAKITESIDAAIRWAETARDWAIENGYRVGDPKRDHDNVVEIIDEMVSRGLAARHLIDTHEAR